MKYEVVRPERDSRPFTNTNTVEEPQTFDSLEEVEAHIRAEVLKYALEFHIYEQKNRQYSIAFEDLNHDLNIIEVVTDE